MLTKIIGPEILRRDRLKQEIYYYGLLSYKTLVYVDPSNKACIVVGHDPGEIPCPETDFDSLNAYFEGRCPEKTRLVEVTADRKEIVLAKIAAMARKFAWLGNTQKLKLRSSLCYITSILAFEDIIPNCRLDYEINPRNWQDRWILRHAQPYNSKHCVTDNFKLEGFLRQFDISHNKYPLYGVFSTDFILVDVLDLVHVLLKLANAPIMAPNYGIGKAGPNFAQNMYCGLSGKLMQNPVTAADGYNYEQEQIQKWFERGNAASPVTWQRLLHQGVQPNGILKREIKDLGKDQSNTIANKSHTKDAQSKRYLLHPG